MNEMKIEKLTSETQGEWVSVWNGPWIVTGTNNIEEARKFVLDFLHDGPSLGNPVDIGASSLPDWSVINSRLNI